jgi:hypothetical protein
LSNDLVKTPNFYIEQLILSIAYKKIEFKSNLIVVFHSNSNFKVRRIYFEGLLNLGLSKTYKWKKNCGAPCQKRTAKALRLDLFAGGRTIFLPCARNKTHSREFDARQTWHPGFDPWSGSSSTRTLNGCTMGQSANMRINSSRRPLKYGVI